MKSGSEQSSPAAESLSLRWAAVLSTIGIVAAVISWGLTAIVSRIADSSPSLVDPLLFVALTGGFLSTFCCFSLLFTWNGWKHEPAALRNRCFAIGLAGTIWFFAVFLPSVLG